MSEELTKVKHAEVADKLKMKQIISLIGNVKGSIEFDGSEEVEMETTIERGDISNTTIEITELSGVDEEEIQSKEITGKLLYKIKNKFKDIKIALESKLGKTETATSAEKLSKGKNISLVGNVKGSVVFDGSKDVEIQTEITSGDIKDTVVSYIEEISDKEELLQDEKISKILGKIKRSLKELDEHMQNKNNPHEISKEQLGLENVENTKDINKPISNATKQALAFKDVMGITTNKERGYYYLKTKIPYEINEFVRCDLQINGLQNCCIDLKIMMYVSNYYNDIKDYVAYSIGTNYYGNIHVFFDDDNLLVIGIPLLYNYQQVRGSAYYTYKAENKTGENLLTGEVFIEQSDYIKGKKRKVSFPVITNNDINIFSNNKINSCIDGSNEEWNTKSETEYIEDLGYYVLKLTTPHHYFKSNMIEVFPNELYEFNFGVQTLSNISKKYGIHIGLTVKQNFKVYIYDYESREWVFEKYNTNAYFLIEYGLSQRKYFTTYILGSKILIQDIPSPKYTDTEQDLRCIQLVDNDTRCQIRSGYNSGQEEGTSWYLINPHLRKITNERDTTMTLIANPTFTGDVNAKGKIITKGFVKEMNTIDLSTLNQDLYYPVLTSITSGRGFFEIIVDVELNSGIKPSWSTHPTGGFSCYQHMLVIKDAYGVIDPYSICLGRNAKWTKDGCIPVGYSQMTKSGNAILWLRGGGKYFVWDNNNSDWEIKTTEYINNQQSVKPQSTVVFEFVKSTIHANIQADNITSVTPAVADNSTKVATTSFTHSAIASDRAYSTTVPVMNGSASAGSSNDVSRGNHVHPTDSTRAPVLNPTLTGTVSINNTNTKLNQGNGNSLRITTPSGWTDIGSQNSGFSHFQTDRPQFYFDKPITVNGDISSYNNVKRTINGYNLNGNALTASNASMLEGKRASDFITINKVTSQDELDYPVGTILMAFTHVNIAERNAIVTVSISNSYKCHYEINSDKSPLLGIWRLSGKYYTEYGNLNNRREFNYLVRRVE